MQGITGNMIVKNEDQWVWYAINAILPYVDRLLITDTGSTDNTLRIIDKIKSPKIFFEQVSAQSALSVTAVRQSQLISSKTDWIWVVDADEIYPDKLAQEIIKALESQKFEGVVVKRYDLLGDIYHRQQESVGTYELFGHSGHLLTRLVNKAKIKGLHYQGEYPQEGLFDSDNHSTRERDPNNWYITQSSIYHAMYLRRSSLGKTLSFMPNRSKYKVENGIPISDELPKVFSQPHPPIVPSVLAKRGVFYDFAAAIISPVKSLYRKLK